MTSRERIERALLGKETDHIPFSPFLAYVWEHFPKEIRDMGQPAFLKMVGADPLWRGSACPVKSVPPAKLEVVNFEENGRTVTEMRTPIGIIRQAYLRSEAGNTSFLVEHPLKTRDDYKVQMWIEENTSFADNSESVDKHFVEDGQDGLSLGMLIPRGKSAYQSLVEHMAGTEELVYAVTDFPETVEALWRTMVAKDLEAVRASAKSKYDFFITWEDSSTQNYSPAQYDAYIGSEIGEWCRILASAGKRYCQHACGHVKALAGRMKAHRVHAIESLSPPPTGNLTIREARSIIGKDMGIIGGIEPTQFLDLSLPDLRKYVESTIEDGRGGPFVLANSDSCPPGVSVDKFKLVAEIAHHCSI